MAATSRPQSGPTARRYDVDWVRVLAMASVFLFHNARFFNFEDWQVKNGQLDQGMTMVVNLLDLWIMPLMFVISGAATCWALGRGAGGFLKARVNRLLIPLIFGIFALAMPQVYMERVSHGQFRGSFLEFIPRYFDGWYALGGNFAWMGLHLWYLEMLFIFSVLALPLFLYVRGGGRRLLSAIATVVEKPGGLLLLAVPAILLEALLNPADFGFKDFGGWSVFAYLVLFINGYLIFAEPRLDAAVRRQGGAILAVAFVTTVVGVALASGKEIRYGSLDYTFWNGYRAFVSWCWVLGLLGVGMRTLRSGSAALSYANEAVLPFYMLHQAVIVTIGYFIAAWQIPVLPKYLLLVVMSFAVIMAIYERLVRRINLLRFLFGLKPLPRIAMAVPSVGRP
jgi:glucans biosynthesis protein C